MNKVLKMLKAPFKHIIILESSRTKNKNKVKEKPQISKHPSFIVKFMSIMSILR